MTACYRNLLGIYEKHNTKMLRDAAFNGMQKNENRGKLA